MTDEAEASIKRLMKSGNFQNPPEIIQVALQSLEAATRNSVQLRPEGYFAADYNLDEERTALEQSMATVAIGPER